MPSQVPSSFLMPSCFLSPHFGSGLSLIGSPRISAPVTFVEHCFFFLLEASGDNELLLLAGMQDRVMHEATSILIN